jgi:hypothetical protein
MSNTKTTLLIAASGLTAVAAGAYFYLSSPVIPGGTGAGGVDALGQPIGVVSGTGIDGGTSSRLSGGTLDVDAVLRTARSFARSQDLERAAFDLASTNPEAALEKLASITDPADRALFLRGLFTGVARLPAADALKLLKKLEKGDRDQGALALVTAWRGGVPPVGRDRENRDENGGGGGRGGRGGPGGGGPGGFFGGMGTTTSLGFSLLDGSTGRAELAVAWAKEMTDGPGQAALLGAAAQKLVITDPTRALALGEGLDGREKGMFLAQVASGWSKEQPAAALAWAQKLEEGRTRDFAMGQIMDQWVRSDPSAAASALAGMPADDTRAKATRELAQAWGRDDTRAALAWAAQLPAAERQAAEKTISEVAPVGVGARIRPDRDGYPIVQDVVADSPAGKSGAIPAGSKVAAISDENGQMLDTKNMRYDDLMKRLAGQQGSQLQLQIIAPGATEAKPVTITREQIYYKRATK